MNNDPVFDAFLYSMIVGLVFLLITYTVNKQAAQQATAAMESDTAPIVPVLPLIDVDLDIIVTDANGQRWRVHFGVMDVQMVEDGE